MKLLKRIGALILVFVLIVTGIQYGGMISEAADTEYTEMTASSIALQKYQDGSWRFYLNMSASFPTETGNPVTTYKLPEIYVNKVDGTSLLLSGAALDKSGSALGFVLWGYNVSSPDEGTTIVIKSGQYQDASNTAVGISITKDIELFYENGSWVLLDPNVTYTEMVATSIYLQKYQDSSWRFYINMSTAFPTSDGNPVTTYEIPSVSVTSADGTTTSISATALDKAGSALGFVLWGYSTQTPDEGTVLTIHGGHYKNTSDSTTGIYIMKDIELTYTNGAWVYDEPEVEYAEMTASSIALQKYADGSWRFYLNMSTTFPTETGNPVTTYELPEIYVNKVDGTSTLLSGAALDKSGSALGFVLWGYAVEQPDEGTTIVIKGGKYKDTANTIKGIYITEDIELVYESGTWVLNATTYTEMRATGIKSQNYADGSWRFYINMSAAFPTETGNPVTTYELPEIYVNKVDGTSLLLSGAALDKSGSALGFVLWGYNVSSPDEGTTIVIKSGQYQDTADTTVGIHITEDIELVYENGTWTYIDSSVKYTEMSANSLYFQKLESNSWRFYINMSAAFPTATGVPAITYEVPKVYVTYVDGTTKDLLAAQLDKAGTAMGFVLWQYGDENPDAGTTVTIKGGRYKDQSDTTVGIYITEDIVLVYDGYKWIYQVNSDEEAKATFTLTTENQNASDASTIYLTSDDSRPVTSSGAKICPVDSMNVNGVLYNGGYTEGYLCKPEENIYSVSLNGIEAVAGDTVTIQGMFEYNYYAVEYNPITLYFDGAKWHTCQVVTPKRNANGGLDIDTYINGEKKDDTLPYDGNWKVFYRFVQGGLYRDNELLTIPTGEVGPRMTKLTSTRYYISTDADFEIGEKLVLDGIIANSEKNIFVKFERTTFQKQDDGSWIIVDNTPFDTEVALAVNTEFSTADGENVTVVMEPSKGILGEPGVATYKGLWVTATDASGTVTHLGQPEMTKTDRGMLKFTIAKESLPSGSYTITVKTGLLNVVDSKLSGVDNASLKPVYNNKDSYIYVNEYGIGYTQYVEYYNADSLTGVSGNATYVQWTVTSNDKMTQNTEFLPENVDSGVFINGIRYDEIPVQMTSETTVKVALSGYYTPTSGDKLMVIGTFEGKDEIIKVVATAASYDGSTWTTAETGFTTSVALDITDSEYVAEGTDVTITGSSNAAVTGNVLYRAGNYTIVRKIGDVTMTYNVSLYRPNDLNQNNTYDAVDLVKLLKCEGVNGYKDSLAETEKLAAESASVESVRAYILGKTKADDTLPTKMIGSTGNTGTEEITEYSKYITSVSGTINGTTVIGMSDTNADYQPKTNYDDYGLDYVLDLEVSEDREIRILQLSDTQIIDSTQIRSDRTAVTVPEGDNTPEGRDAVLYNCLKAAIEKAQPDLILLAGDNVYGEYDDTGASWLDLIEHMDSFKIPWAAVYGNHDNESLKGVKWQNEQLENSTYCLFYSGHDIGGNSNYSIGIAKNGKLQRTVYMMDTNYCMDMRTTDGSTHINADGNKENGEIIRQIGFTDKQKEWYRTSALRINAVAGETIPSMLCYHVATMEVLLGVKAAGYQEDPDSDYLKYTIGVDNYAQAGDSGYKGSELLGDSKVAKLYMIDIMNEVGGDGASFGHEHTKSISTTYGGIRWTFGLKTGSYDTSPSEQGGTLFTISADGSSFEVTQIVTQTE